MKPATSPTDSAPRAGTDPPGVCVRLCKVCKTFASDPNRPTTLKELVVGASPSGNGKRGKRQVIEALREIDLEIRSGESFGIVGANGSGKSTLLKLIAGITTPTSGEVEVKGTVLGVIELGAGFNGQLSGEENVRLQGAIYGLSSQQVEALIDPIFEYAQLDDFRGTPLRHYSSGMIVRLGFSIAIACDPEILVVDEVLSVGDVAFQHQCLRTIDELRRSGTTIVFVTHQMELAERVCDRIVWLGPGGKIRKQGESLEVLHAYYQELLETQYGSSEGLLTQERIEVGAPGRFGTGDATIEEVRAVDQAGNVRRNFRPGEPLALEIRYACREPVESIDCSLTLDYEDGSSVCHWRAELEDGLQRPIDGKGRFRLAFDPAYFLPGRYTLSCAISPPGGGEAHYDLHFRLHHFSILPEGEWVPGAPMRLEAKVIGQSSAPL